MAELVYLGGLTQFHVETSAAGRLVSHRMDDEVAASLEPGKRVTLTWPAEHAYVLAGAVSSESLGPQLALGAVAEDLGECDDDERGDHDDGAEREDLRLERRRSRPRVDVHRIGRLPRRHEERRDRELVEASREGDQAAETERGHDQRQRDPPERRQGPGRPRSRAASTIAWSSVRSRGRMMRSAYGTATAMCPRSTASERLLEAEPVHQDEEPDRERRCTGHERQQDERRQSPRSRSVAGSHADRGDQAEQGRADRGRRRRSRRSA